MAIAIINPTTGQLEEEFAPYTTQETESGIADAQTAFEALRSTSYDQRAEWMRHAAEIMESEVEQTARMLVIEMGKPIGQARAEVLKCAKNMRFYADRAAEFLADEPLGDPSAVGASAAYKHYEPLGVVLAVMPWNYPLWQVVRFAAPALMAGNTGLLKHASNVPRSALYLDSIFERAGFPSGSFRTLLIGSGQVDNVLRDPRVKAVTLTGSEGAGRAVAATAGEQIKKSVMELGGSDPFIVMPSADLEAAATTAVRARVLNNGQSCIAGKRFIAHADIYDQFAALFAEKMAALSVGDPLDETVDVGPLATASGRDELEELVEDAIKKGATALAGGHRVDRDGWFYEPTVLAGLHDGMRIVLEEAFGPVASVYQAETREDALRIANQTTFGLSSAVWTNDPDEEAYFIANLDAGAVFVNGMTVSYPELPFGGVKASGFGRELAAEGIREFTNVKTVWKG